MTLLVGKICLSDRSTQHSQVIDVDEFLSLSENFRAMCMDDLSSCRKVSKNRDSDGETMTTDAKGNFECSLHKVR